jgi:hypothetical protein
MLRAAMACGFPFIWGQQDEIELESARSMTKIIAVPEMNGK